MFEYIRGKLVGAAPNKAVVEVHGIGYGILIALNTYGRLPQVGQDVMFYVAPVVREDAHLLYGFLTQGERELFEKFTQVSGIGPKTALALIGHMEITDLQMAIMHGNISLLSKVPGIGKKTAERLVIEMRDKVTASSSTSLMAADIDGAKGVVADAISALVNLGYHPINAQKAVKQALGEKSNKSEPQLGQLITLALRNI
jgi:Holliday junction DNA helicase RuvA